MSGSIITEVFGKYCDENKIVSEFVRFHPIVNNQADFRNMYETVYMHNTVGTDIANHNDPVQEEFSKSCRKNIRQAINKGVTCRITESPENLNFSSQYFPKTSANSSARTARSPVHSVIKGPPYPYGVTIS